MFKFLVVSALLTVAVPIQAQQFKVQTRVFRPSSETETEGTTLSQSVTIFHAGQVYDLLRSVGEVTVVDQAHDRFIIFSARRMIGTKVAFSEVDRILGTARDETANWAERLQKSSDARSRKLAEPLRFQLEPKFKESFDPARRTLSLTSPRLSYMVDCQSASSPELQSAYLQYADLAAKLNFVLYPNTIYPAPRLALNAQLKGLEKVPARVQLDIDIESPVTLIAEHRYSWKLESIDRQYLNKWQSLIHDPEMEWVTFRDYHRRVIVQKNVQARK